MKLGVHALRLCQMRTGSDPDNDVKSDTLVALLRLLESPMSFNNIILRHHLFCILQVLARRFACLILVYPLLLLVEAISALQQVIFSHLSCLSLADEILP